MHTTEHDVAAVAHKVAADQLEQAVRLTFASEAGKRVLYWILEQAGIYGEAFTGENNATNYRLGSQLVGRRVIGLLDSVDPRFYPQLLLSIGDLRDRDAALIETLTKQPETEDSADEA
jgi:hypothetical protein